MADVQYVTLYLGSTAVTVVVGSQLEATLLASGATTTPTVPGASSTTPASPLPDVRTPVATIWFSTPFGPQAVIEPSTQAEYTRRDYPVITAAQAAAYYASGAEIPHVSYVTGAELPAAVTTVINSSPVQTALRAALGAGSTDWLKSAAAGFSFAFTTLTTVDAATGLPTAAAVKWPDGTTGTFTGTTDGLNGYTGYAVTWGGSTTKTVTASGITYDSATGLALGPTTLAVA